VKTYKTFSGTYTEDQLGVVVWRNPKNRKSSQARFLETMTAENSPHPMAFPIESLLSKKEWSLAVKVSSLNEVLEAVPVSTRARPVIIPLPVAESAFGWFTFYIPTEYTT